MSWSGKGCVAILPSHTVIPVCGSEYRTFTLILSIITALVLFQHSKQGLGLNLLVDLTPLTLLRCPPTVHIVHSSH